MDHPNILLIHSDQHRFDCLGVNNHPLVQTPNLDRLAADGVNFTHAFTPNPLCTPARNSLLFGQWSFQHGVLANPDTEFCRGPRPDAVSFSALLARAGWNLGYVGKWHVSSNSSPLDAQFAFDSHVAEDEYGNWRRNQGLTDLASVLDQFRDDPNVTASTVFLALFRGRTDVGVAPLQSRLAWGADRVVELIEGSQRPFFIRWDPSEPHLPNVVPEPYASMYPPESIEPWPSFGDLLKGKPYAQAQQRRAWNVESWTWNDWAPVVGRYLGDISLLDAQVGRLLDALDRQGQAENTMVVYTTDHGDMCGSHGMWDKHFVMYDDVVRVPLIMRWPGHIQPGTTCDAFVSHAIDLAFTFCAATGVDPPDAFAGADLLGLLNGAGSWPERPDILSAYHGNQFGLYSQRMARDRHWKYVWNLTAEDELYDLDDDPAEITNRALDPTCAGELRHLRQRLLSWLNETGDPLASWAGNVQLGEGLTK